jgi:hypothetical protein
MDEFDLMIAVGVAIFGVVCMFAIFGLAHVFLLWLG